MGRSDPLIDEPRRTAGEVTLRAATLADSDALLEWRNDPAVVRSSLTARRIDRSEHEQWLASRLADPSPHLWIAEEAGAAVGQVRIDSERGVGTVSIAVAPNRRGRGVGTAMLIAMIAAYNSRGELRTLRALIHPGNAASLRAFANAGFRPLSAPDGGFVVLERRVTMDG